MEYSIVFPARVTVCWESVPSFGVTDILKAIAGLSGGSRQRPQARSAQIDDGHGCSHWQGVAVDAAGSLNQVRKSRPA
jgi:hypothetical protein